MLVNGEYVVIEEIQHEITEEPVTVYNFQVADFHTYYAGESSVLVHNANEYHGGAYQDVDVDDNQQRHHTPADSISPYGTKKGPVIVMDTPDHMETASWGSSTAASEYRAQQADLISQGMFREAVKMDVADVRSKFGTKYDAAIAEMLDYVDKLASNQ